jgi:hypothetical protein
MTMNSHLKTDWVALLVVLMLAVEGCTPRPPENPAPPPAGWPTELADFTIAWTAEPGIELVTDGAAIATRAYVESYYLASITENEKYLYPGFADAVEPDHPGGPPGTSELHPKLGYSDPAIWIGTARHHVLGITRSDSDVTLTACAYLYGTAREIPNRDGYAANVGTSYDLNSGIFPMRVGLRAPSDSESKSSAQEGPSKAPYDNVFGGWKITSFLFDYLSQPTSWPEKDADLAACIAKADGPPESRHFIPRVPYPLSDFPTHPATPGWPEKPAD